MSQQMSDRIAASTRIGAWGWVAGVFAACTGVSACLGDIELSPCVRLHRCGAGGDDGEVSGGAASAGEGVAGGVVAGGGAAPAASAGAAGEGGDRASAGKGSDPTPTCESCSIEPSELVDPCAHEPYRIELNVKGGMPPFSWELDSEVSDWSVTAEQQDDSRAVLATSSARAGETRLTVQVTDGRGAAVRADYRVEARDACWFAYTAAGSTGPELALLDPLSAAPEPAELDHNTNVYDFKFSPDGRFLAYRYDADASAPQGRHLAMIELSTLDERGLEFVEDAVTAYAWSPDSNVLAVAFSADGVSFLGGARMPSRGSSDPPLTLSPTAAFVEDNLVWVRSDAVAYHAELYPDPGQPGQYFPNPDHLRTPFYAKLGVAGFDAPQLTLEVFEPNVFIRPAPDGFWILNWYSMFFPMSGSLGDSVAQGNLKLLAPNGAYAASLEAGTLRVFKGYDSSVFPELASASSKPNQSCTRLLAWSSQDKIACVTDVENSAGSHGELRLFELKPDRDELEMSTLQGFCTDDTSATDTESCTGLRNGYGYAVDDAFRAPRGFSPSGRWFAFTRAIGASSYLYWADLAADPPALSGTLFSPVSGAPRHLAFSSDNRKLAVQLGSSLLIEALGGVSPDLPLTSELESNDACVEDLPTAPDRYCGNTWLGAPYKWSPDSKAIAYRAGERITVADVSLTSDFVSSRLPGVLCEAPACSGDFEFQPSVE